MAMSFVIGISVLFVLWALCNITYMIYALHIKFERRKLTNFGKVLMCVLGVFLCQFGALIILLAMCTFYFFDVMRKVFSSEKPSKPHWE